MSTKKSYAITTVIENCTIATQVMESLEEIENSPEDIISHLDADQGLIEYIKGLNRKTLFQDIPDLLQQSLVDVICFISEAQKEYLFLDSNRQIIDESMAAEPSAVTTTTIKNLYELGLCKYLTFIKIFFTDQFSIREDEFEELNEEDRQTIIEANEDISKFEILNSKEKEQLDITFETYMNVKFMEDELVEGEDNEDEYDNSSAISIDEGIYEFED